MTCTSAPPVRPYGLRHQVRLRPAFTQPPPGSYDPGCQLTVLAGVPLVRCPDLMIQFTVTWGTTDRDNKTDDGG